MGGIVQKLADLSDHYVMVSLFMALFILTFIGAGNVAVVGMLGLILCAAGFVQGSTEVDLWVFVPLVIYNLFGMLSSCVAHGNTVEGYASIQLIFPVIYLLASYLTERELSWLRRLCIGWAAFVAMAGMGQFLYRAISQGSARRLGGFLGNANALGIFLVLGWFALQGGLQEPQKDRDSFLQRLEPVLLAALALTLSMGSFLSMAAGIAVLVAKKRKCVSGGETFFYAARMLAKVSLGVASGILMYLAAARTDWPQSCLIPFAYVLAAVLCWPGLERFLEQYRKTSVAASGMGLLVTAVVIAIRPSAVATFAERLEMMRNGLGYLADHPLLGVGPYRWRILNLYDSDKYFNTYHIHNVFIHVGAELGIIAMGMLLIVAFRSFRKEKPPAQYAGGAAFLFHNLMDTGFFYPGIVTMAMLTTGEARRRANVVNAVAAKLLFGAFAAVFAWNLFCYVRLR